MYEEISIGTSSVASNACRGRGCHPGALVSLPGRESCESVEVLVEGSEGLGRARERNAVRQQVREALGGKCRAVCKRRMLGTDSNDIVKLLAA